MGWSAFPDEVTDAKARAEMLDETIDILTLLYQRKQFDYDGKHHHLKLTQMDLVHYPPRPVQQPRIPLWCVGLWPSKKSLQRVLKYDGIIVEKRNVGSQPTELTANDVREIKAYVDANRDDPRPFDVVLNGKIDGLIPSQAQEKLLSFKEAGATWWIEGMWDATEEQAVERIRRGPPQF
jgi:alkanesulfonate monooxygenase SsuD/methylene tetrahydromethanopterin reductase-like flavin-dependent oxidoreductase (luciferase family)